MVLTLLSKVIRLVELKLLQLMPLQLIVGLTPQIEVLLWRIQPITQGVLIAHGVPTEEIPFELYDM